jgi:hypothetical protein
MEATPSARFFTWAQLRRANRIAERRGYNRQLTDQFFIDFGRGTKFPIAAVVLHSFAGGKPVDEHYRCFIDYHENFGEGRVVIDCDKSLYEELEWLPAEA